MKNTKWVVATTALCALAMTACQKSANDIRYIPFQSEEDGKWGLVSDEGKVLFENEFRNVPTYVTDERFFVQNQDGFWELYTAEEQPKKIGPEFRYVTPFSDGRAVVSARNAGIAIIDKEGEVKVELKDLDGKDITSAYPLIGNAARVQCDTMAGAVNRDGKKIIDAKYAEITASPEGMMLAYDHAYRQSHFMEDGEKPKGKMEVFNNKGESVYTLDVKKYWGVQESAFTDKYITVCTRGFKEKPMEEGSKETYKEYYFRYEILDMKGNTVFKGGDKVQTIFQIRGDEFIYSTSDDKLLGVKKMDGTDVVKPEYQGINFIGKEYYACYKNGNESNDYQPIVVILDKEGKKVSHSSFISVAGNCSFRQIGGKLLFAQENDEEWQILTPDGQKAEGAPKVFALRPYSSGDPIVYSDAIDYAKFFKALKITPDSMGKFTFSTSPKEAIQIQQTQWSAGSKNETIKPQDYTWMTSVYLWPTADGHNYAATAEYPQSLSKQNFKTKKVFDGWTGYGNWYYYHNERVSLGYSFNNITPKLFKLEFNSESYYGKLRQLYKELVKYTKKWGTQTESQSNVTIADLKDGRKLSITLRENQVVMAWGKLPSEYTETWRYSNVAEKLESTYDGNKYQDYTVNREYSDDECWGD